MKVFAVALYLMGFVIMKDVADMSFFEEMVIALCFIIGGMAYVKK